MPYIYSMAGKCYFDDYTLMRGLVMDFPQDKNVLNIGDQYMFGSGLMICPVYEYKARTREVYFPEGAGWYNLNDGKFIAGGQKLNVAAPYDCMPVYVPAGSILPLGDVIQNTTQAQNDLTIYVYAGKNGIFSLYEDENINYNYEKDAFSTIEFAYNDQDKTLTIGNRKGNFNGMIKERDFNLILVEQGKPSGIDNASKNAKTIHYNGAKIEINLQ